LIKRETVLLLKELYVTQYQHHVRLIQVVKRNHHNEY